MYVTKSDTDGHNGAYSILIIGGILVNSSGSLSDADLDSESNDVVPSIKVGFRLLFLSFCFLTIYYMTTNKKIENILRDEESFLGVFMYDQLDKIDVLSDAVFIVNYVTQAESDAGKIGHYVVVDYRESIIKGQGWPYNFYFDPYGFKPDEPRVLMGLPNTNNITKFISKIRSVSTTGQQTLSAGYATWDYNSFDFQLEKPWDSLCGVYSILYVKEPDFKSNPIFYLRENNKHLNLDRDLETIFTELRVLGDPFTRINIKKVNQVLGVLTGTADAIGRAGNSRTLPIV